MTAPSSSASIVVREATPADVADVARLLSARDEQRREPAVAGAYLWGLDPEHTCTWLAYAGDLPVGITMVYLRDMTWPGAEPTAWTPLRAGYWAHLFVEPEYRRQMVYPQLVLAMLRGMAAHGISLIYTATRQPPVAEGHQKLGFALAGTLPLRLRPLRPFRLLAKHKNLKLPGFLIRTLDGIARPMIKRKTSAAVAVQKIPLADGRIDEVCALMNSRGLSKVHHVWNADEFRRRFATTLDGTEYHVYGIEKAGRVLAAIVTTLIERGNDIRAGVVVTLVADVAASQTDVNALLATAEQFAYDNQAELMLALGESVDLPQLSSGKKYLCTDSESYHLLVYPKKFAQAPYAAADIKNWVFDYADHDAF